jgi:transmembrane sensor
MESPEKNSPSDRGRDDAQRDAAARWVVRQDRTLSAAEVAELAAWLDADPRHGDALERARGSWKKFREIGAAVRRMPEPATESGGGWRWVMTGGLAAAAAVLLWSGLGGLPESSAPASDGRPAAMAAAPAGMRTLPDGSVARLKGGAELAVAFTATERRVTVVRGEVFFEVTKDVARPFLVAAGNVTVRAVGTAFAVRFDAQAVDVLVTEGTVRVTPPSADRADEAAPGGAVGSALVEAGYRATVGILADAGLSPVTVSAVSAAEIARSLAWQAPMLDLAGATVGELAAGFAQRTGRRIEVADRALAAVRIGGRLADDDVEGFVRALEEVYGVRVERRADGVIVLRKGG